MYSFLVNINNGDSMNEIVNVFIRTIIILIILFIMFKLMGKKQVSQMNIYDYIIGITLGSIAADISLDIDKNFLSGITCLIIYSLSSIIVSYLSLKSITLRNFFYGKEVPLIVNGKINYENMSKNKITINTLETESRLMGYFNLNEINNAILEPSGLISFEPKNKTITKKDMNLKEPNKGLVYNLIIDGKIIKENLKNINKTEKWLQKELKIYGKPLEDIILFTIDEQENINIYSK